MLSARKVELVFFAEIRLTLKKNVSNLLKLKSVTVSTVMKWKWLIKLLRLIWSSRQSFSGLISVLALT